MVDPASEVFPELLDVAPHAASRRPTAHRPIAFMGVLFAIIIDYLLKQFE
jgi:hypothetical protein